MPISINTNVASMAAQRSFMNSNAALETAFERLSSGKRINSAIDDAAGLAIGNNLVSRVTGLNQAIRNTNDGVSMIQVAEGALDEVTSILQRMRDLAVQSANGSLTTTEQGYLDTEQDKLSTTLDAVLNQAAFNGIDLIDTNAAVSLTFQVGADNGDTLAVSLDKLSADVLSVTAAGVNFAATAGTAEVAHIDMSSYDATNTETHSIVIDGTTFTTAASTGAAGATGKSNLAAKLQTVLQSDSGDSSITVVYDSSDDELDITWTATGQHEGDYSLSSATNTTAVTATAFGTKGTAGVDTAAQFIATIDTALATVASDRASLGAVQAQMESTVRNLANVAENTAAATGRIMDTDYAAETANLTKAQILQQAATSILAQANAQPQSVLSLLQ